MSRYARRVDRPHAEIREALEDCGCTVLDVSRVAGCGCDLVVWTPRGHAYAVEVKDGSKPPSKRALTDSEAALAFRLPRHYRVIGSVDEAIALLGGR
jgi:hypothetical protein